LAAKIRAMSDEAPNAFDEAARQGIAVDASEPERLRKAIDLALDYRGDVTITLRSTGASIEGYIFDRTEGPTPAEAAVRILPRDRDERITVPCHDIARIRFTGRDTAAGKSFETWMRKYVEKKLAGERASIEPEPLDEG
jgi:hypothetical protein